MSLVVGCKKRCAARAATATPVRRRSAWGGRLGRTPKRHRRWQGVWPRIVSAPPPPCAGSS
eukprot:scaffold4501_cov395-Prasinococcus_capsulatus_cf.AAC.10